MFAVYKRNENGHFNILHKKFTSPRLNTLKDYEVLYKVLKIYFVYIHNLRDCKKLPNFSTLINTA